MFNINKIKRPVFRLCNDSVFKELFSKVPEALILLISDVLNIDYNSIKDNSSVELTSELHKTKEKNKTTVCDFVVKVGEHFRVNVKFNKSISNDLPIVIKYKQLPKYKISQLNINTFRNFNGKVLSKAMLLDEETCMPLTEAFWLYNLDVVKCYDIYYNKIACDVNIGSRVIKWGTALFTSETADITEIIGDDFMDKEVQEKFINVADELKEKHNIVVNMLNRNLDIDLISDITGLKNEEIIMIKESL